MSKSRTRRPGGADEVHRMTFYLSERRPIRSLAARHTHKSATQFDMHYVLELGIVLAGEMERHYPHWSVRVKPGQVWLCGVWEPHGFRILEAPCNVLVLVVLPELLANSRLQATPQINWLAPFNAPPEQRPQTPRHAEREMLALAQRLIAARKKSRWLRDAWHHTILTEMLLLLLEPWQPRTAQPTRAADSYTRIAPAIELAFGSRRFTSEQDAAASCGMCRNTFNKLFTGTMGVSFAKFALRYRLNGAALELAQTSAPIKAVAARWGFSDVSHLHRALCRHFHCTPSDYRARSARASDPHHAGLRGGPRP